MGRPLSLLLKKASNPKQRPSKFVGNMSHYSQTWLLALVIFLLLAALDIQFSEAFNVVNENGIKTSVFLSPMFVMGHGSVVDKYYHNIDFPRGHIAVKGFNAEVVDEAGHPVPLQETYLHHWVVGRYYHRKSDAQEVPKYNSDRELRESEFKMLRNSGICQNNVLGQYYGLGSETRRTSTFVPEPYGIEVGNPADIPAGYEEKWLLNVHGIDTRGVEHRLGCTECRCDLYNVTYDGGPLSPDYIGGLRCCRDGAQCKLREGIVSTKRNLYMRYTVKWVDWDDSILPVKIYIFDVTDTWKSTESDGGHLCKIEYDVESCSASGVADNQCIDIKRTSLSLPSGGYVVYGLAHQHSGGVGSALYGKDGRVICSSMPTYGKGKEAGNESGYIVGMSTCYPKPGSVKISDGETLVLESNYSSTQMHTGVMGLFYILVADSQPKPMHFFQSPRKMIENMNFVWGIALLGVAITAIIVGVAYQRKNQRDDGYESIAV